MGWSPSPPDHRQQIVLLHDFQHGFGILMDAVPLQPNVHTTVSVGFAAFFLTFPYLLGQRQIFGRHIPSPHIVIVAASGYFKESAHFADTVFIFMAVDYRVFDLCSHFLSVSERKSRISSFSISNCFIRASLRASLYRRSASLSASVTSVSFDGLPFFLIAIPAAILS